MELPKVKSDTIKSIIEEVFTKNHYFGVEEFESAIETENEDLAEMLFSFTDTVADYLGETTHEKEQYSAIAKIATHLVYKSLSKQLEINEMES
jgi:hypothetical protein